MSMGEPTPTLSAALALITRQRKLADSSDPLERAKTPWVAVELDKRLSRCTDAQIAELLARAQERLPIFEPEFAVIEHARRRLLNSRQLPFCPKMMIGKQYEMRAFTFSMRKLPSTGLASPSIASIPEEQIASASIMVPDVSEARVCLITSGFREHQCIRSILVDADTDRRIRLIQER
jgi:hypothetical protein